MTDRCDALVWWWLLRNANYDTVKVVDHYDASDVYEDYYKWEDKRNKWDGAADLIRATYVAEACVVVFEDVDGNCLFWMQIILDEGYPRISNYSTGDQEHLIEQAQLISERVADGNLSLWKVLDGTLEPSNFNKEVNND